MAVSRSQVRTYDAEEANAALPRVREIVQRIVDTVARIPELEDEARIARYGAARDPSGVAAAQRERLEMALEHAQAGLVAAIGELEEMGVQLKDAQSGLIDFLSYRDGELVELCWKLGEPAVAHWHRIGEGFPGRKPLKPV
jgi:hypothetical protein